MVFHSNSTSFLCEYPMNFQPLVFFYPISPLKFALAALQRFLSLAFDGSFLEHYTQRDGVEGTWVVFSSYGMTTFAAKVAIRAC